jgi:hypothetical protein
MESSRHTSWTTTGSSAGRTRSNTLRYSGRTCSSVPFSLCGAGGIRRTARVRAMCMTPAHRERSRSPEIVWFRRPCTVLGLQPTHLLPGSSPHWAPLTLPPDGQLAAVKAATAGVAGLPATRAGMGPARQSVSDPPHHHRPGALPVRQPHRSGLPQPSSGGRTGGGVGRLVLVQALVGRPAVPARTGHRRDNNSQERQDDVRECARSRGRSGSPAPTGGLCPRCFDPRETLTAGSSWT